MNHNANNMFSKKCTLCKEKISKGRHVEAMVKIPGWIGPRKRDFCSLEHVLAYRDLIQAISKRPVYMPCALK